MRPHAAVTARVTPACVRARQGGVKARWLARPAPMLGAALVPGPHRGRARRAEAGGCSARWRRRLRLLGVEWGGARTDGHAEAQSRGRRAGAAGGAFGGDCSAKNSSASRSSSRKKGIGGWLLPSCMRALTHQLAQAPLGIVDQRQPSAGLQLESKRASHQTSTWMSSSRTRCVMRSSSQSQSRADACKLVGRDACRRVARHRRHRRPLGGGLRERAYRRRARRVDAPVPAPARPPPEACCDGWAAHGAAMFGQHHATAPEAAAAPVLGRA